MKNAVVMGLLLATLLLGVAAPADAASCSPDSGYPGVAVGGYADWDGAYAQAGPVAVRCHWDL